MTVYALTATVRNSQNVAAHGFADKITARVATVELAAAASSSTIDFGNIPSAARIMPSSAVYVDDLATSGSPTLDLGFFPVEGNITADDDALNDGLAISSAVAVTSIVKDVANYGKHAWEYVNGQTTDPGGLLKIKGTIRDAATTATGTVTLYLAYTLD